MLSTPMTLHYDNQSATVLSKDIQHHVRTKHIDLSFHFICEAVTNHLITLIYFPTQTMVVDILMQLLHHGKKGEHASLLGLLPPWKGECWIFKPI